MTTADHSVASIKTMVRDLQTWPSALTARALARIAKQAGPSADDLAPYFERVHLAATDLLRPGGKPDPTCAELRRATAILDTVVTVRRQAKRRPQ